ncbi:MAG: MFS transporter [bacterium]|nr:MFS transporter [bacterium]
MNLPTRQATRSRRGWYLYDWANSAFATVIMAALLPVYFADAVVPPGGVAIGGQTLSATSLWGYASGISALLVFLVAPLLGAVADVSARRKRWLVGLFVPGALATILMFLVEPGRVGLCLGLYLIASATFVAANIFYDSLLPFLGPPEERDSISARGFAWGYLGGGLIFLFDLILVQAHGHFGLDKTMAVRIALASAGVWWGGFGLLAWRMIAEPGGAADPPRGGALTREALRRIVQTFRDIRGHRNLALFLIAYFFYNDGLQTVVKMAGIYGKDELGLSTGTLLGTLLMVQFVGIFGALIFGRLANRFGSRQALMTSLVIWIGVVVWGWYLNEAWEFWILGGAVGFCLGATQALSRSYFARFIPANRSAEYYGFYSVFAKLSAVGGPLLFAFIRQITGTARLSVLALGIFFVAGLILLSLVRDEPATARSRK